MPLNLYSSATTDSLLADKLSDAPIDGSTYGRNNGAWAVVTGGGLTISTLSNAATATLNAGVPSSGQALVFDGTDLAWQYPTVTWGAISGTLSSQMDLQAELDLKAPLAAPSFTGGITVDVTGITFSDSTVQSSAAVAGANFGDVISMTKVNSISASGGYYEITFAAVNLEMMQLGLYACRSGGANPEAITSFSSSTTWTYTTTAIDDTSSLFLKLNGQVGTFPIKTP